MLCLSELAKVNKIKLAGAVRVERTSANFKGSCSGRLSYTPVEKNGALPRYRAALFGASIRRFHLISLKCIHLEMRLGLEPRYKRFADAGLTIQPSHRISGAVGHDSNGRTPAYKAGALPTELRQRKWWFGQSTILGPTGYEPAALPAELPNR